MTNPDKPDYTHGSTGTKPQSAIDYNDGDSLESENLDYFINTPFEKIKSIIDTLVSIDSDGDGVVDRADSAATADDATAYKGNDIDSDGDGKVDSADVADDATTVKGNDIDSNGDGKVNSADSADEATNVTSTYKGNDIDSDGDGKVDSAQNADYASDADASTYKGIDIDSNGDGKVDSADSADTASLYKGSDIDSDGDGTVDSADEATNVTSTYKGNDIDSDGDGVVDAANDTTTVKGNDIDSDGDGTVDSADNAQKLDGGDSTYYLNHQNFTNISSNDHHSRPTSTNQPTWNDGGPYTKTDVTASLYYSTEDQALNAVDDDTSTSVSLNRDFDILEVESSDDVHDVITGGTITHESFNTSASNSVIEIKTLDGTVHDSFTSDPSDGQVTNSFTVPDTKVVRIQLASGNEGQDIIEVDLDIKDRWNHLHSI